MAGGESSSAINDEDPRSPIKIEPMASPEGSDASRGENGSHGGSSEDSLDNSYDAPLDFSTKKPRRELHPMNDSPADYSPRPNGRRPPTDEAPSPDLRRRLNGPDLHGEDSNSSIRSDTPSQGDKIGEPPVAFPGALPGLMPSLLPGMPELPPGVVPNPALLASLPMFNNEPRRNNQQGGGNGKNLRPFKAYPKDPLSLPLGYYAIPGMLPMPGMDPAALQALGAANSEDLVSQYRTYLSKLQEQTNSKTPVRQDKVSPLPHSTTPIVVPTSPPTTTTSSGAVTMSVGSPGSASSSSTSTSPAIPIGGDTPTLSLDSGSSRKRGRIMPDEQKDVAYWDRRRKNNEAAKRSRDARRAKEDEIAIRAALLEQENLKLRVEVAALKNETAKLRCMLYNS